MMRNQEMLLVLVLTVCFGLSAAAHAGVVYADVAADYRVGALGQTSADVGIADTAGDGSWNYYQSNSIIMSEATASALLVVKNTLGLMDPTGYGGNGGYDLPAIVKSKLFADGIDPAANELTFHPDVVASNGQHVLFRWTAGASSAGNVRISGTVSNPVPGKLTNTSINSISFHIVVNDVIVYEVFGNGHTLDETAFDINAFVNAGDTVDFVGTCQGHLSADESLLSAQISEVPEPATMALLGFGGLALIRRRRA